MLEVNRGSDLIFRLIWPGEEGEPMDLTGVDLSLYEVHGCLEDNIIYDITDLTGGEITVTVKWDDSYRYGRSMKFRLKMSYEDKHQTTPHIEVMIK